MAFALTNSGIESTTTAIVDGPHRPFHSLKIHEDTPKANPGRFAFKCPLNDPTHWGLGADGTPLAFVPCKHEVEGYLR